MSTTIEWTDETWNPTRGCSLVSPGCKNCYAMRFAHRFSGKGQRYAGLTRLTANGPVWTGKLAFAKDALDAPYHWREPRRVFVDSMSDLFHEAIPDWQIFAVWEVMARSLRHTFQVLTKRPERMRDWFAKLADTGPANILPVMYRVDSGEYATVQEVTKEQVQAVINSGRGKMFHDWVRSWGKPPKGCAVPTYDWMEGPRYWPTVLGNLWLGVSVEDRKRKQRIAVLRETPAHVRFLSLEPLLEDLGPLDLSGISWVIVGGESGPGARPMREEWVRQIVEQCQAAGVAVFVKQMGRSYFQSDGGLVRPTDHKGGDIATFPEGLKIREFPATV